MPGDLAKGCAPVLQCPAVQEVVPCQDGVAMDAPALQKSSACMDLRWPFQRMRSSELGRTWSRAARSAERSSSNSQRKA